MNWRNVRLIFLREVRDQLRDRRTLFMIAVLPLLLYPSLGVGMLQMTVLFSEQPRTVVVLGVDQLPPPPLIDGDRFVADWFENPLSAELLHVVTDNPTAHDKSARDKAAGDARHRDERKRDEWLLTEAVAVAAAHAEVVRLEEVGPPAAREVAAARRGQLFAASGIQVLILVPDGMAAGLAAADARLRDRTPGDGGVEIPKPLVLYNVADQKSAAAYRQVVAVLDRWEADLLKNRLRQADLPESLPSQVVAQPVNLAGTAEQSAATWSLIFPALLVLMTVTGAFYPAVDLAAGEKERGTMETLLICPASRPQIVVGKFLTVMLFSVGTALLNLVSMGLTGKYVSSLGLGAAAAALSPPPLASLVWVAVLMIPLAALFSALCLALATFARSTKEGQYYLTPLLMVVIGITVFCLSPAVEITPLYSVLPVAGVALLLKDLLGTGSGGYGYLVPVLLTSVGYAALALWWAVEQFKREDVLFREAERFELGLWLRHLLREKERTPGFAQAGFAFLFIMLLQFGAMGLMSRAAQSAAPGDPWAMPRLLLIQQVAVIAFPVLLLGVMLTGSLRDTFRLRWPGWRFLAAGAVLPLTLAPLAVTLIQHLGWFFPPLPPGAQQAMAAMGDTDVPLWLALLAFAVAPGVCEELAFRGFILSGFLRSGRVWLAIALSSLCFGVMHMIPQQVFNATLVGLVLGLLAVRSGSLWPGVLFHFLFNGSQVLLGRPATAAAFESGQLDWLGDSTGDDLQFRLPILIVCGIVSAVLIHWLAVTRRPRPEPTETQPESGESPLAHSATHHDLPAEVG